MQKAGSKAIQGFLLDNAALLTAKGIDCALDLRRGVWHQDLFYSYSEGFNAKVAVLAGRTKSAVLSYEKAYGANPATIERIISHATSVSILFFCRAPVPWLNSMKNQIVKAHRTSIAAWEELSLESGLVYDALCISNHLKIWEEIVGRDSITVARYSPQTDVVPIFTSWLGLLPEEHSDFCLRTSNPNPALDARSIRIILEVKRLLSRDNEATLIRAIDLCHKELNNSWIDSRRSQAVNLLSAEEQAYCAAVFDPHYQAVLDRYEIIGKPTNDLPFGAPKPIRPKDLTPTNRDRAIAEDIVNRALSVDSS